MEQLGVGLFHLVDGFHHVDGDTDGPRLIGDGAGDGLTDPPRGVGGELEALGIVEFFNGLDEAQVALLNQVQELHTAAGILFGDADHQPQVGLLQPSLGGRVVLLDLDGQVDLFFRRQQRDLADLLEIDLHRVVHRQRLAVVAGIIGLRHVGIEVQRVEGRLGHVVDDLDVVGLDHLIQLVQLVDIEIQINDQQINIVGRQLARGLAPFDQMVDCQFFVAFMSFHVSHTLYQI